MDWMPESSTSTPSSPVGQPNRRWWIVAALVLAVLGVVLVKFGWHRTAGNQVVADNVPVTLVVLLDRVVSLNAESLLRSGQKVQLSVRNRPRGEVTVKAVNVIPRKALLPKALEPHEWIPDENHPYESDMVVSFSDTATQSKDGYVTKGIKLKTGMNVTIETFNAYLDGVIMAVEGSKSSPEASPAI